METTTAIAAFAIKHSFRLLRLGLANAPSPACGGGYTKRHRYSSRQLRLRHHILGRARPAGVGEIEHDAVGILVFRFIKRIWRGRSPCEVGAARIDDLLFGGIEVIDPHAEMVKTKLLVLVLLLEQRDIDDAVRQINAAARRAGAFQSERFLVEFRGFLSIRNDDGDMANSGHEGPFLVLRRAEKLTLLPSAQIRFPI